MDFVYYYMRYATGDKNNYSASFRLVAAEWCSMFHQGTRTFLLMVFSASTVLCTAVVEQTQLTPTLQSPDTGLLKLYQRLQTFINPTYSYAYQLWGANYSTSEEANELCREKLQEQHGIIPNAVNADCTLQIICTTDHSRFPSLLITGRCYGTASVVDTSSSETLTTACGELGFDTCRPLEHTVTILVKSEPKANSTTEEWRLGLQNIVIGCQCL